MITHEKNLWTRIREQILSEAPEFLLCDLCDGMGVTLTAKGKYGKAYQPCKKCKGEGKLNWIQNVFQENT